MSNPERGGYAPPEGDLMDDPLGSIPEHERYTERLAGDDGNPTRVHVAGDRSYPLSEGERLVMIGQEPYIRKNGIDTPFEKWKADQTDE